MKKLIFIPIFLLLLASAAFAALDTSAPLINAVSVVEITKTSAKINWITDENATSAITYASQSLANSNLVTNHSMTLEGLKPAAFYHFNITSCDAARNCATASGKSLSFATIGYQEYDPRIEQSNFSKSVLTSASKVNYLNFSEQNPAMMIIDSKEGLYFKYDDQEFAIIFPKQTDMNTTMRMLPSNSVQVLDYGEEYDFNIDNETGADIYLKISSVKKTEVAAQDTSVKYVKYAFNITIRDLNKPTTKNVNEAGIKFELNPVYESKYEPPVKEGNIGVSASAIEDRKASVLKGIFMAALVFVAALFAMFLMKGDRQQDI